MDDDCSTEQTDGLGFGGWEKSDQVADSLLLPAKVIEPSACQNSNGNKSEQQHVNTAKGKKEQKGAAESAATRQASL